MDNKFVYEYKSHDISESSFYKSTNCMMLPKVREKLQKHQHPEWILLAEYITDLIKELKPVIGENASILQLGSGCGYILDGLWTVGYRNLTGLDRNPIREDERNPKITYIQSEVADWLPKAPEFDLILCHRFLYVQSTEDGWLFREIAKRVKRYLFVIERETKSEVFPKYRWPRDYQKVFEPLGLRQIFTESNIFPNQTQFFTFPKQQSESYATITRVFIPNDKRSSFTTENKMDTASNAKGSPKVKRKRNRNLCRKKVG